MRKIAKAIDAKNAAAVLQDRKIHALEEEVERLQQKKRKKVQVAPNERFATIADIQRAQGEAVEVGDETEEVVEEEEVGGGSESDDEAIPLRRSTRDRRLTRRLLEADIDED